MVSRRNLHIYGVACIVVVTLTGCLSTFPDDGDVLPLASTFSQNGTESDDSIFQGSPKAPSSNEIYNGEPESLATPSLSNSLPFPSTAVESPVAEKSTVTITPSAVSIPSMVITATQVTLDHRIGSTSTESGDGGSTEDPNAAVTEDISATDATIVDNFSPEKISSSGKSTEVKPILRGHTYRKARYHRLHEDLAQNIDVDESITEHPQASSTGTDFQEGSVENRENEEDGGTSYGDFQEENEIPEQLPTPLALINPNGEGNNPPLEDDFAEAFKKVNANGKRRRFRGGRRERMKMRKRNNETKSHANPDATPPSDSSISATSQQDIQNSYDKQNEYDESSDVSSTPKYKRLRSTTSTSSPALIDSSTSSTAPPTTTTVPTTTSTTTEPPTEGAPVVRNGPKPLILKHVALPIETVSVTPSPQLEKPSGHTEKISTYFFSTPSPSARLRLRQKIRESYPSSSTTTTTSTTTATPPDDQSGYPSGDGHEVWKNDFPDFQRNSYFAGPTANNFKVPSFVPLNLGLEQDKQETNVENSIDRPEANSALENKAYSLDHHHHHHQYSSDSSSSYSSSPSSSGGRGNYDYYSSSSTTPRPRTRHHSFTRHRDRDYDSQSQTAPTSDSVKSSGTEYYDQGSNTESSNTYSSQRTPPGSHYDRTKDRVIFYNDSPYSAQQSPAPPSAMAPPDDPSPGSASHTVSTHFHVSENPNAYDSPPSDSSHSGFTRGKVYPAEDSSPSHHESRFKNGPPDSSHIESPNILDHQISSPLDHDSNSHPYHHSFNGYPEPPIAQTPPGPSLGGSYSHSHTEMSHTPMQRPGDSSIYGTVEEVPAHGGSSFEHPPPHHHSPFHHHRHHHPHHHHGIHPSGPIPYPFGSPPQYNAPSMTPFQQLPPPPPPSLISPSENNFISPAPAPLTPPQSYYPQNFPLNFHPQVSENTNGNQPDSHFPMSPPNLAGSPSEIVHGSVDSQGPSESSSAPVGHIPDPESTLPTSSDLPFDNENPPTGDPQQGYNAPQVVDHNFPPHSHTMATQADYEPANPPLPHDHPFHKSFIPFPTQDLHGAISLANLEQDHPGHDTNSIGNGPYHPGTVENVPTGRPPFQSSPPMPTSPKQPLEFVPIPDDVKENDIFNTFASKPYEGRPPSGIHEPSEHHLHGGPPPEVHDHHHHLPPQILEGDESPSQYLPPNLDGDGHHSLYPTQSGPPPPGEHVKELGYSGPVNEIHSGTYHPPTEHSHEGPHQDSIGKPPYPSDHTFSQVDIAAHGGSLGIHDKPHDLNDGPPGLIDPHSDTPPKGLHGSGGPHRPHDFKDGRPPGGNDGKKGGNKLKTAFSNTPYVLMFPQLIPEEKMRPSPPSVLSKEIPVIQASSMSDFSSGEKPPLGPGFQAVPVHPRHQMYQVLAKTHYEKMMEKYRESKRKPPSAIYTPYGILVPVGTNVDPASSIQHSVFAKPGGLPPKFRGEKSLLSTLLGSSSTTANRFFPPNGMRNKFNKLLEYEPAIDLLAEKLAMKIVSAQRALGKPEGGNDEKKGSHYQDSQDIMTMESKVYSTQTQPQALASANPEMADYLKGVLKGQIAELVETSVSDEERRPSTATKFLNSLFRKSRINMPGPLPPKPLMQMSGSSMSLQSKVPPPPGSLQGVQGAGLMQGVQGAGLMQGLGPMQSMPGLGGPVLQGHGIMQGMQGMQGPGPMQGMQGVGSSPHHTGIGPPFPPPQLTMPQGPPGGLLGTIRRLFSFGPPPERHDMGMGPGPNPNFAGRTLYTGPNNNTGSSSPYVDGPSPRSSQMLQQYQMMPQKTHPKPKTITPSSPFNMSVVQKNFNSANKQMVLPTTKPSKKKKKPSNTGSKKPMEGNRLNFPISYFNKSASVPLNSSTTPRPTVLINKSIIPAFSLNKNSSTASSDKSPSLTKSTISKPSSLLNSLFLVDTSLNGIRSSLRGEPIQPPDFKKVDEPKPEKPLQTITPLDMFQTLLGSTRSVLNFFKSEARKASGPTVLIPRSAS